MISIHADHELIRQQKQRIAELTAHVERLHSLNSALLHELIDASYAAQCGCNHPACKQCKADGELSKVIDDAKILHASTPAQSLAEIKAQAIEEMLLSFPADNEGHIPYFGRTTAADYAKQLRGEV